MKIKNFLDAATKKLSVAGIGTARLDTLVLIEDITGRDRAWLLAHPDHELSAKETAALQKLLDTRAKHWPLAYVRGKTEFYGREFIITPAVLEPRPESEAMIDALKQLQVDGKLPIEKLMIADVGAGSGALGITAYLELHNQQDITVELLEIDKNALQTARLNVEKFTLNIAILQSNLLKNAGQDYDVLLCNLPYVPDNHAINDAAMHEPKIAIFGGPDGLDTYRDLFKQAASLLHKPRYILTESLPPQHATLERIAGQNGYRLDRTDDFIQVFSR